MKRTRFTDEQIIGDLTEHEAGAKCADLCRKYGVVECTFYNWKAKFGGMTASEAKRLKSIQNTTCAVDDRISFPTTAALIRPLLCAHNPKHQDMRHTISRKRWGNSRVSRRNLKLVRSFRKLLDWFAEKHGDNSV